MLDFIRFSVRLGLAALAFVVLPSSKGNAGEVLVFAASSLTLPLTEIANRYETEHAVKVRLSFAASSVLAKQLARGAPAAIFISANPQWMRYLVRREVVTPESGRFLAANRLVVAVSAERPSAALDDLDSLPLLLSDGRLSLGDPAHVPAGRYAKAALTSAGVWEALSKRLIPAANVRAALRFVELDQAGAGIVYATDAYRNSRVRVVHQIDASRHPPIRYLAALVPGRSGASARAFFGHLFSAGAQASLARHGFAVD